MIKVREDVILNENDIGIVQPINKFYPTEKFYIKVYLNKTLEESFVNDDKNLKETNMGYMQFFYKTEEERNKWFTNIEKQLISLGKMIEF